MKIVREMQKLRDELDIKGIQWEDVSVDTKVFWMVRTHFNYKGHKWSVINGFGSYGGVDFIKGKNQGLLECMTDARGDTPIGFLTAKEVLEMMDEA